MKYQPISGWRAELKLDIEIASQREIICKILHRHAQSWELKYQN